MCIRDRLCADFLLQRLQHLVMDLVDVLILERALGGLERDAQRDGLLAFLDMLARIDIEDLDILDDVFLIELAALLDAADDVCDRRCLLYTSRCV